MVLDTSSLISLAWAGRLPLLSLLPVEPVILDSVFTEAVTQGRTRGHADAAAIESALVDLERIHDEPVGSVDARVVRAAEQVGTVVANDQALGRRAASCGARWLRTADLVLIGFHTERLSAQSARSAVLALHGAGRLTERLRDEYLEVLR